VEIENTDRRTFGLVTLLTILTTVGSPAALAQSSGSKKAGRREVIRQRLPGEPAREIRLIEVDYPAGTGSPPHIHANGVMAYVLSGSITSQVDDGPERTYGPGESWWEPVGAKHHVSRNASATEPAKLLAIYVAPADVSPDDLLKPL
jgi:quercetin dioxygenase-like cupin family protein